MIMAREIKFRGKDIQSGKWRYGYAQFNHDKTRAQIISPLRIDISAFPGQLFHVDKDTVCQFTGLHDKNGKEIYEGDILRSVRFNDIIMLIVYDEFEAAFMAVQINKNRGTDLETRCHVTQDWINKYPKEVVGNIFDNPKLLDE